MHRNAASFAQGFCARKNRQRVSFVAHPEKDQVKARKLAICQFEIRSKVLVVLLGGIFGYGILAFDARDLLGLQWRFGNQRFSGHAKIAISMVRLNMALVTKKKMHVVPGDEGAESGIIDEQAVEKLGCGSASQGHVEGSLFFYGSCG